MSSINSLTVKKFLRNVWDAKTPLLLALSGGPDSLALFHMLLDIKPQIPFAIAHVDHGWREESAWEATQLGELAKKYKIPFHLKKLQIPKESSNLEDLCRDARLGFFKELIQKEGYAAVLLGHHSDDQAEVLLKRIFEGASLAKLQGMTSVSKHEGISLWRPLLTARKKDLESWLEIRGKRGFHDKTNVDTRFLRGRMRKTLLPFLSNEFGKEISPRLLKWGKEAEELQSFIHEAIAPLKKLVKRGRDGLELDLGGMKVHPFLLKQFLVGLVAESGLKISEKSADLAVGLVQSGAVNKEIALGGGILRVDKGRVSLRKAVEPTTFA